jgi:hypothetical protein
MLKQTYGKAFVQRGMALQMMQHPSSRLENRIEKRYQEAVERRFQRARSETSWTTRVEPTPHAKMRDKATVREVIPHVDMFQRFGLTNSSLGKAFLGVFGRESFAQLTFHVGYLPRREIESYTAFMPSRQVRGSGIRPGDLVAIRLCGVPVGNVAAWFCECLEHVTESHGTISNMKDVGEHRRA